MLDESEVFCPYCGEAFTALVDPSQGNHAYVEDCHVCCQPIDFQVEADGLNVLSVTVSTDMD